MVTQNLPTIAVVGATGQQGGSALRALQAAGQFRVRAITRNPEKHAGLADEVVKADLNQPDTLKAAFAGAHGVFMVTNFWEEDKVDEIAQTTAAVHAAKAAGVNHFIWSTLPDVEKNSGGKYDVAHFTDKAKADAVVAGAGFKHHTFVILPFLYENLQNVMAPQPQQDGTTGWTLPIDPSVIGIYAGSVKEFGTLVAGAFKHPDIAGNGEYLPLVGQRLGFGDMVATLNAQGHNYSFNQVPAEAFADFFPGAAEIGAMLGYFEEFTYLGGNREAEIALAREVAGETPTDFANWARSNMPVSDSEPASRALADA